ncbi:MAG: hydroxypyruvate isomerase [Betaproteobacteria bacterium]|nr:hydroxypyruvate isomerase [Betaproteobacteria bacterium]
MLKLAANLSLLFNECEFLRRFDAAAKAGFRHVEYQFPYDFDKHEIARRARAAGVEVVLHNIPSGNAAKGDRGIACLPERVSEFREGVGRAIEYALAAGCPRLNCLAGIAPQGAPAERFHATLVDNLRFAATELARAGLALMIEPVNTRTIPGFFLSRSAQAVAVLDEVGAANAFIQYDLFHMQIMEGDLARTIERLLPRIGHMQIADVPDRHEPGSGEINFDFLLAQIDRLGYAGAIGCEYIPAADTLSGLAWAEPYLNT